MKIYEHYVTVFGRIVLCPVFCVCVSVLVRMCVCLFACMHACICMYLYTCISKSLIVCNKLAIVAHYGPFKKKKKKKKKKKNKAKVMRI